MKTRTLMWFDSLTRRDFENGAVINEIREVFKERDTLEATEVKKIDLSKEEWRWLEKVSRALPYSATDIACVYDVLRNKEQTQALFEKCAALGIRPDQVIRILGE